MNKIIKKEMLNDTIMALELDAPLIAKHANPGQFVIIRPFSTSERIPITINNYDAVKGTITIIVQIVGKTTKELATLSEGDFVSDLVGPLGKETPVNGVKRAIVVGGGLGSAISLPVAKRLKELGANVTTICGFRNKDLVILNDEFEANSNKHILMTDDGSMGRKGLVTMPLEEILSTGLVDTVYAIGPLIMMKFVVSVCKKYNQKVIVSMNPIMIDGTGMCGGCRLSVAGKMCFACVDGPDFDGFDVDFDEVMKRNRMYQEEERHQYEEYCNLLKAGENNA